MSFSTDHRPPAGERQIGYRRWVPVNNELKMDKNGSPTGIVDLNERLLEKQAKDPECGMMVGTGPDDVVRWTFPVDGPADLGILQKVARSVEYLGVRPHLCCSTSSTVLSRCLLAIPVGNRTRGLIQLTCGNGRTPGCFGRPRGGAAAAAP